MEDFANYLISKQFVSKKVSHFYRLWVINPYDYTGKKLGKTIENSDIDSYISHITKSKMEWQVDISNTFPNICSIPDRLRISQR